MSIKFSKLKYWKQEALKMFFLEDMNYTDT